MSKSLATNLIALVLVTVGYILNQSMLFSIGLFALSGAFTNWLAVHMLFEKVPGLYGSGVIPARFEQFKAAIKAMMMEEFFTRENMQKFLNSNTEQKIDLQPVISKLDFEPAYDSLVDTIQTSQFGGMLAMFGGVEAIQPLKQPFIEKIKNKMTDITQTDTFHNLLQAQVEQPEMLSSFEQQIEEIIESRLDELTPEMVKEIVQNMIKQHLGWLVVWGGVFGGLFGLLSTLTVA